MIIDLNLILCHVLSSGFISQHVLGHALIMRKQSLHHDNQASPKCSSAVSSGANYHAFRHALSLIQTLTACKLSSHVLPLKLKTPFTELSEVELSEIVKRFRHRSYDGTPSLRKLLLC